MRYTNGSSDARTQDGIAVCTPDAKTRAIVYSCLAADMGKVLTWADYGTLHADPRLGDRSTRSDVS